MIQGSITPPLVILLSTARVDPVSLAALVTAVAFYLAGVRRLARDGRRWPKRRSVAFLAGLALYAGVDFGFLGVESQDLRFAFASRVVLLLLAVPSVLAFARPLTLLTGAVRGPLGNRLVAFLESGPVQLLGRPMVSPLVALAVFCVFLTPLSGTLRVSAASEALISLTAPVLGLLLVGPIVEGTAVRSSAVMAGELALAFAETVADALPGILVRLSPVVLDQLGTVTGAVPGWFPSPLRDQQLEGDLLWFFAEVGDLPALVLLVVNFMRSDRAETRAWDALSDEEMEALTREHLRRRAE